MGGTRIEDDDSVASGIVRRLQRAGFEVELACDGAPEAGSGA